MHELFEVAWHYTTWKLRWCASLQNLVCNQHISWCFSMIVLLILCHIRTWNSVTILLTPLWYGIKSHYQIGTFFNTSAVCKRARWWQHVQKYFICLNVFISCYFWKCNRFGYTIQPSSIISLSTITPYCILHIDNAEALVRLSTHNRHPYRCSQRAMRDSIIFKKNAHTIIMEPHGVLHRPLLLTWFNLMNPVTC